MYIVYFRHEQWAVGWRYSSGEIHFIASYPSAALAKKAAVRMNAA